MKVVALLVALVIGALFLTIFLSYYSARSGRMVGYWEIPIPGLAAGAGNPQGILLSPSSFSFDGKHVIIYYCAVRASDQADEGWYKQKAEVKGNDLYYYNSDNRRWVLLATFDNIKSNFSVVANGQVSVYERHPIPQWMENLTYKEN